MLLLIIYTTFCDTFSHKSAEIDSSGLVAVAVLFTNAYVLPNNNERFVVHTSRYSGDYVLFNSQISHIRNSHAQDSIFGLQISLAYFHSIAYLSSSADIAGGSFGPSSKGLDDQCSAARKAGSECSCLVLTMLSA